MWSMEKKTANILKSHVNDANNRDDNEDDDNNNDGHS